MIDAKEMEDGDVELAGDWEPWWGEGRVGEEGAEVATDIRVNSRSILQTRACSASRCHNGSLISHQLRTLQ